MVKELSSGGFVDESDLIKAMSEFPFCKGIEITSHEDICRVFLSPEPFIKPKYDNSKCSYCGSIKSDTNNCRNCGAAI